MDRIDYSAVAIPGTSDALADRLGDLWCAEYRRSFRDAEIVAVTLDPFVYLFDLPGGRVVAAYGVMNGKVSTPRDGSRIAGYRKRVERKPGDHIGHLMLHSGGGGTDINLFSQVGRMNIGPFRELERVAVANPGAFYFVRPIYGLSVSQRPVAVEQGVVVPGSSAIEARHFQN